MTTTLRLEIPLDVSGLPDLDRLNGELGKTEEKTSKLGSVSTGVFQGIGQAGFNAAASLVQAGISAVMDNIGNSIELASNKAEAASKVNVLFGDSARIVEEASKGAATQVGLSSGAYLDAAGTLGNLLTNFDITGDAAADMSVDMIQLAADVGSFNNADPTEVVEAMGAAFRGESEPLRRFGVMLDEASIKAKALELGLYSGTGALDKSARATATYQLILEDTAAAQGDFARTSDGLANAQRIANARVEEAWTRVGDVLAPIAAKVVPMLADGIEFLVGIIEDVVTAVSDWVDDNQDLLDTLSDIGGVILGALQTAFGWLLDIVGELGYRIGGLIGSFIDLAGAIIDAGDAIIRLLSGDLEGAAAAGQRALDRLQGFQENVQRAMGDTARRVADDAEITAARVAAAADDAAREAAASSEKWWAQAATTGAEQGDALGFLFSSNTADAIDAGTGRVDTQAGQLADTLPDNLREGTREAQRIAAQTPGDIAASLRSTRTDWKSALDLLKDDMQNSLGKGKEIAQLEAALTGKALTRGLASTDPIVRAQAQETVDLIHGRLATLEGVGFDAGSAAGRAVVKGLHDSDTSVRSWAALAARALANNLKTGSPTKEGPMSEDGGPERWMERLGYSLPMGLTRGWDRAFRRVEGLLGPGIGGAMPAAVTAGAGPAPSYYITVQAGVGDPVAIGREIVERIQAYERSGGRDWRASSA